MTDNTTPDSEPTASKAFRNILTENPAAEPAPKKPFQPRSIILTPETEAAAPAPRPAIKPRNFL